MRCSPAVGVMLQIEVGGGIGGHRGAGVVAVAVATSTSTFWRHSDVARAPRACSRSGFSAWALYYKASSQPLASRPRACPALPCPAPPSQGALSKAGSSGLQVPGSPIGLLARSSPFNNNKCDPHWPPHNTRDRDTAATTTPRPRNEGPQLQQ